MFNGLRKIYMPTISSMRTVHLHVLLLKRWDEKKVLIFLNIWIVFGKWQFFFPVFFIFLTNSLPDTNVLKFFWNLKPNMLYHDVIYKSFFECIMFCELVNEKNVLEQEINLIFIY